MSDKIGAKLAFDSINGLCKGACHYRRIVDQNIDCSNAFINSSSSFSNSVLATKIQRNELGLDVRVSPLDTINDRLDL